MGRIMKDRGGLTLAEFIFFLLVLAGIVTVGLFVIREVHKAHEAALRASCMGNTRQIAMAMIQYAGDYGDRFPPLVDASGNMVPAVDNEGVVSSLPARSAFAVLLKQGYLTTDKVFVCPSSGECISENLPPNFRTAPLNRLVLGDRNCSYGWDPTKKHTADPSCAILADKPRQTPGREGTALNNSQNHSGEGQNVFYNDGHVKWATTPRPDAGDDPDVFTGSTEPGKEYWKSTWDARIIR
jgi:hypothetical protein